MHKLAALLGDEAVQDAAQNAAQDVAAQAVPAAAAQPVADDGIQLSRQWHPAAMAAKTVIALGQQSVVNGKRIHSHPKHSHRYAYYKGSSDSKPRQSRQPSEQRPKNKNRNLI